MKKDKNESNATVDINMFTKKDLIWQAGLIILKGLDVQEAGRWEGIARRGENLCELSIDKLDFVQPGQTQSINVKKSSGIEKENCKKIKWGKRALAWNTPTYNYVMTGQRSVCLYT